MTSPQSYFTSLLPASFFYRFFEQKTNKVMSVLWNNNKQIPIDFQFNLYVTLRVYTRKTEKFNILLWIYVCGVDIDINTNLNRIIIIVQICISTKKRKIHPNIFFTESDGARHALFIFLIWKFNVDMLYVCIFWRYARR